MAEYLGCVELHNEEIHGKIVPGFPSYSIDTGANVWSFKKSRYPIKLRPGSNKAGYPMYGLTINGKQWTKKAHTLMAMTYLGDRPEGYYVRHIDSNKCNNKLSNLEYCTPAQNTADGVLLGNIYGVLNKNSAKEIYELVNGGKLLDREIAEKYGVCRSLVNMIKLKKRWRWIHE